MSCEVAKATSRAMHIDLLRSTAGAPAVTGRPVPLLAVVFMQQDATPSPDSTGRRLLIAHRPRSLGRAACQRAA